MHIKHIEISNFRKLRAVRIDMTDEKTVFVGANNSGKTSAMAAFRKFLVDAGDFSLNDFTLPHCRKLDEHAVAWEKAYSSDKPLPEIVWNGLMPSLDIWLHVEDTELRFVRDFLPTIEWTGALLGVRLRYEAKDPEALRHDYLARRKEAIATQQKTGFARSPLPSGEGAELPFAAAVAATETEAAEAEIAVIDVPASIGGGEKRPVEVPLWPQTITEYLQRRMRGAFGIKAYLLDVDQLKMLTNGEAHPQPLDPSNLALNCDPLRKLIRVDEISAQRGSSFL